MPFDTRPLIEQQKSLAPFDFIGEDGETYLLPNVRNIRPQQLAQFREMSDPAEFGQMVRDLAPGDEDADAAAGAIENLPLGVLIDLFQAWARTAGEAGKSLSASSTTNRAGRRQKPTSRSGKSTSRS
jgi:hypothetical protein